MSKAWQQKVREKRATAETVRKIKKNGELK